MRDLRVLKRYFGGNKRVFGVVVMRMRRDLVGGLSEGVFSEISL